MQLTPFPKAVEMKQLVYISPGRLPLKVPFGPVPPPPDWAVARALAEIAAKACKEAPVLYAQRALDTAYGYFANVAERELDTMTGKTLKRFGARVCCVKAEWRSVFLKKQEPAEKEAIANGFSWASAALRDLRVMCEQKGRSQQHRLKAVGQAGLMQTTPVVGTGLCARLDAAVKAMVTVARDLENALK